MHPLPQTRQVLAFLASSGGSPLEDDLRGVAEEIARLVPSCIGVSLTIPQHDLTLTFVSTSAPALTLDVVQSAHGGPCLESAESGGEVSAPDLLDEDRWRRYATTAAAEGVRSSLSVPLLDPDGAVAASLNVYAGEPRAFDGVTDRLRRVAGGMTGAATTNADLAFTSRDRAERSPDAVRRQGLVNTAVGCLMAMHQLPSEEARLLLESRAELAGVDVATAAARVLEQLEERRRPWRRAGGR